MKIKVRYRLDNEEYFTIDESIIDVDSWSEALNEIETIESHHTVLSIERILD